MYTPAKGPPPSASSQRVVWPSHSPHPAGRSDVAGRVRQPSFAMEPNGGFRPGRYNAYVGHHEGHGYDYDGVPMPVPYSDPIGLAVSSSKMDMARAPSPMSSSSEPPASPSGTDSPAECLLPTTSASSSAPGARSGKAPVPVFYDYTEGFVEEEEEVFVANGSIPSLSSQGSMARRPRQHAGSHVRMAPRDPAAFFRDVSARIAQLSLERTLRPTELETSSSGTVPSVDGSSRGESERRLVTEEDPSPGPSTSARKGSDPSTVASFGTDLCVDPYPCDEQAPASSASNSAGFPHGADGSPDSSRDWEAAVETANRISCRNLGLPSAASSSASGSLSRGDELDLADGTPSEVAWREANLEAECRGGTLAKLNTLGRNARDCRQANLPSSSATRGGLARDGDEERSGRCVEQDALPKLTVDPRHGGSTTTTTSTTATTTTPASSGTKPPTTRAATALSTTEDEAPVLLSRRSFPWLHKDVGADTANSSQRSLVSPPHLTPPPHNSRSTDARSRQVRMEGTGPASGLGIDEVVVPSVPGQGSGVSAPYKLKLRVRRSCAGQSTTSAELRPWNIDDNYPWTSTALDVHVGTPELATRLEPPPARPRRFKLRMPRKWSPGQRRSPKGDDAVQKAAVAGQSTPASSLSEPEARPHRGVGPEGVSIPNDDVDDAPCLLAGSVADTPPKVFGDGSAAPVERAGENDAQLSPSTMLARSASPVELRSVFSSDSSDDDDDDGRQRPRQRRDGGPSTVRDRFSSLRARFAASRALNGVGVGVSTPAADGNPCLSRASCQTITSAPSRMSREGLSRHCHHPPPRRSSASPCGGHATSKGPRHASNILRHRTWRVVAGRFRRWVARRREQVSRLRRRNAVVAL